MKNEMTFLLSGLIGGLACVAPGVSFMLLTLTWGVGPAFFVAVVAGIVVTDVRRNLQANLLQYMAGLVVCCVTYLLALIVFIWVAGLSSEWFGFRQSDFAKFEFGIDIVLGFLAAGTCAAIGIALFASILTRRWSNRLVGRLLWAGIVTIVITFIVNYPFRNYWSFYGVLVPLGSSLFCGALGAHFLEHSESRVTRYGSHSERNVVVG